MARRSKKRPYNQGHIPLNEAALGPLTRTESGFGGSSMRVRQIRAGTKEYLCPGCLQSITVGTPHVVVWEEDHFFGQNAAIEERRHWHSNCWKRRLRPN